MCALVGGGGGAADDNNDATKTFVRVYVCAVTLMSVCVGVCVCCQVSMHRPYIGKLDICDRGLLDNRRVLCGTLCESAVEVVPALLA